MVPERERGRDRSDQRVNRHAKFSRKRSLHSGLLSLNFMESSPRPLSSHSYTIVNPNWTASTVSEKRSKTLRIERYRRSLLKVDVGNGFIAIKLGFPLELSANTGQVNDWVVGTVYPWVKYVWVGTRYYYFSIQNPNHYIAHGPFIYFYCHYIFLIFITLNF